MPPKGISARAVMFIVVVFLALVLVLLRWSADVESPAGSGEEGPRLSHIQIADEGKTVEINAEPSAANGEARELVRESIHLLLSGTTNERRATAIQLTYMASDATGRENVRRFDESLRDQVRQALLKGLRDPDLAVASRCREALIGWWRVSGSAAANRHFAQGIATYEAGRLDEALRLFQDLEELGDAVPPDLYRMK
ncbi:MAG: hypothetical protein ACYS8K_02750, partial [Planctomycetota bacterium]